MTHCIVHIYNIDVFDISDIIVFVINLIIIIIVIVVIVVTIITTITTITCLCANSLSASVLFFSSSAASFACCNWRSYSLTVLFSASI